MSDTYKNSLTLRIDWADLDLFGHVNNVAFFKYIQAARVQYCDAIGLSSLNDTALSFMVASSQCQFKKPLKYPGEIRIIHGVEWVKNSSFVIVYRILNSTEEVCAVAEDILVVYDHQQKVKAQISKELIAAICEKEGREIICKT